MPISTLRISWFSHHTLSPPHTLTSQHHHTKIADVIIKPPIINLLKFVVLSSLRCLAPVRFCIIVTISSHYNTYCISHDTLHTESYLPGLLQYRPPAIYFYQHHATPASARAAQPAATATQRTAAKQGEIDPPADSYCLAISYYSTVVAVGVAS